MCVTWISFFISTSTPYGAALSSATVHATSYTLYDPEKDDPLIWEPPQRDNKQGWCWPLAPHSWPMNSLCLEKEVLLVSKFEVNILTTSRPIYLGFEQTDSSELWKQGTVRLSKSDEPFRRRWIRILSSELPSFVRIWFWEAKLSIIWIASKASLSCSIIIRQ